MKRYHSASTVRLRRPHSREINSYITNNVRMILNDLLYFHLLFKVIRQTTGWRGGVRSTTTSSAYWQAKNKQRKHFTKGIVDQTSYLCIFISVVLILWSNRTYTCKKNVRMKYYIQWNYKVPFCVVYNKVIIKLEWPGCKIRTMITLHFNN